MEIEGPKAMTGGEVSMLRDDRPNLIYSVAFDLPGLRGGRTMAKLLCSSLLRHFWSGEIIVFRNYPEPLFPVERKGLEEIYVQTPDYGQGKAAGLKCQADALQFRFRAAEMLDPSRYKWMAYFDADCLALRNLDHLFAGDGDILVQPERGRDMRNSHPFNGYIGGDEFIHSNRNPWLSREGASGINAGTLAVRSHHYAAVMENWKQLFEATPSRHPDLRDQTAWNRLLLDTKLKVRPFERGEIMFPLTLDKGFPDYRKAGLLHFLGGNLKEKIELSFALHMMVVYGDVGGLFFDFLES